MYSYILLIQQKKHSISSMHFPKSQTTWQHNGITHLHHLFEKNNFKTLIEKNGIEAVQYQQLKSTIQSKININNNTLQPFKLIDEITKITSSKKLVSKLYFNKRHINSPKTKWEKHLDLSLNFNIWAEICNTLLATQTYNWYNTNSPMSHWAKCSKWD